MILGTPKRLHFQNVSVHTKTKTGVFKFLRFEELPLQKTPFSRRIRVDGGSNRRNKAVFSNFSDVAPGLLDVVWMLSQLPTGSICTMY